jgi:MbtH protein
MLLLAKRGLRSSCGLNDPCIGSEWRHFEMAGQNRTGACVVNDQDDLHDVVVNEEGQYSIWRAGKEIPAGWRDVGKRAPKAECLAYIDEVWTDMRPLSLIRQEDPATRSK